MAKYFWIVIKDKNSISLICTNQFFTRVAELFRIKDFRFISALITHKESSIRIVTFEL